MDQLRAQASSFAGYGGFRDAFASISDSSATLIAGMAEWIRVTTNEAPTDRVYYLLTEAGLHVGQEVTEKRRMLTKKTKVDYFVPRPSIAGVESDPSGVVQVDTVDGVRVILRFADIFGQQTGPMWDQHKPASAQAHDLHAALVA